MRGRQADCATDAPTWHQRSAWVTVGLRNDRRTKRSVTQVLAPVADGAASEWAPATGRRAGLRCSGFRQCCPGPVCGDTWEGHGLGGAAGAGGVCPDPKGAEPKGAAPRGVGASEAGTADGEASTERPLRAPTTTETPAISRAIPAIPRRIGVCRPSSVPQICTGSCPIFVARHCHPVASSMSHRAA